MSPSASPSSARPPEGRARRDPPRRRSLGRRLLRWSLLLLAVLLALPLLLLGFLETDVGRRTLVTLIEDMGSSDGAEIAISGSDGSLFNRLTLRGVTLSDEAGAWLELDEVVLDWSPSALLSGRLEVALLRVGEAKLERLPPAGPEAPPDDTAGGLPSLPFALDLAKLEIGSLRLGEAVLGTAAVLGLQAAAQADSEEARLNLSLKREDGEAGFVKADLIWRQADERLTFDIAAQEPSGGLATRLLELPQLPALDLAMKGEGALDDWHGTLDLQLEGAQALSGEVTMQGEETRAFTVSLAVAPAALEAAESLAGLPDLGALLPTGLTLTSAGRVKGEELELETLKLVGEGLDLAAKGRVDLDRETVALDIDLALPDGAALAAYLPSPTLKSATLTGRVTGPLAAPQMTANVTLEEPSLPEARMRNLTLQLDATPLGGDALGDDGFAISLDAALNDPELLLPDVPAWTYGDTRLTADLSVQPAAGTARLTRLSLIGDDLDLSLEGDLAVPALAGELEVALKGRLPPLPELGPLPPRVTLNAHVAGDDLSTAIEGELAASLLETESLPDGLGELLGPQVDLAGGFSYGPEGLSLAGASLLAAQVALDLDGAIAASGDLSLTWHVTVEDLAAALRPLAVPAAGRFSASGSLAGDPSSELAVEADLRGEGLSLEGTEIGTLTGTIALSGLPAAPVGTVSLSAPDSAYGPLSLQAEAEADEQGGYRVSPLALSLGTEVALSGELQGTAAGLPLVGRLSGDLKAGPLLQALGVPLQGTGTLSVELTAPEGRQDAVVGLTLGRGSVADLAYGSLQLKASLRDLLAAPALEATLEVAALDLGDGRLDRVSARANGTLDALEFSLQAAGDLNGPSDIALAGRLIDGGAAIELSRLDGKLAGLPLTLAGSSRIGLGDPITVSPTAIQVAGGRVTLEGSRGAGLSLKVRAEGVDLAAFDPFLEGMTPSGRADLTLDLGGSSGKAAGTLDLRLTDFALRREGLTLGPDVDLVARLQLSPQQATLEASLSGDFGEDLMIEASYPVSIALASLSPVVAKGRPLSGSVRWQGRASGLVDYLPLDNQQLDGDLELDLRLAGTPAVPEVAGKVVLSDGSYENLVTGTTIVDLGMTVVGNGSRLTIEQAGGRDGIGGQLSLSGGVDLAAPEAASIKLSLENFQVLGRDDLLATMDGNLEFAPVDGTPTLKGQLTGEQIVIDIGADLPPNLPTLDVVVLRDGEQVGFIGDEPQGELTPEEAEAAAPFLVVLDISVDLPRRVFVRGSGLDSEWGGTLSVTGTSAAPVIRGQLVPQRGQYELLGNAFVLDGGSITFDGGRSIDPILDLRAVNDTGEIKAIASIGGRASKPEISLSSVPPLPEDEVLARVLFKRGTGKLSAFEAVQLAEALAILSGVSTERPMVDRLRDKLGLDVLRLGGGTDDDIASATAGEYIGEDVFVGITQGTTPGSTAATVEIELTPDIIVQGKAGQESSVGIRWQWDY